LGLAARMTRPLAIFDLDGTLVDSRATIQRAMADAFAAARLPPPRPEAVARTVGLGLSEVIATLAPGLPPEAHADLVEHYRQAFVTNRAAGRGEEPLYPGAEALVRDLAARGWRLGIATGKARRGLEHFFDRHGLKALFHTAWCAEDGPGKPHPFMVTANLEATGTPAARAVLVGDATHDIRMARAAGVAAWGVSWGFGREAEIRAAGAHRTFRSLASLHRSLHAFAASPAPESARP